MAVLCVICFFITCFHLYFCIFLFCVKINFLTFFILIFCLYILLVFILYYVSINFLIFLILIFCFIILLIFIFYCANICFFIFFIFIFCLTILLRYYNAILKCWLEKMIYVSFFQINILNIITVEWGINTWPCTRLCTRGRSFRSSLWFFKISVWLFLWRRTRVFRKVA